VIVRSARSTYLNEEASDSYVDHCSFPSNPDLIAVADRDITIPVSTGQYISSHEGITEHLKRNLLIMTMYAIVQTLLKVTRSNLLSESDTVREGQSPIEQHPYPDAYAAILVRVERNPTPSLQGNHEKVRHTKVLAAENCLCDPGRSIPVSN